MFPLDYKSRLPIYEQLNKSISKMAALGALEPNEQLPSVRTLAQDLGINPNTVQKAYQMLEQNGIIYSVPGKGSYISPDLSILSRQKARSLEKLAEVIHEAAENGVTKPEMIEQVENYFNGRGSEQ
ncbi:MAG: GntR family transcriptional regulator [Clostridium sp.]|uniref:GntR family transcriptional regulator n=1 Tax=Clostridium sp. TaxID=1506 RepID=UPI0029156184|nr:GntR family transcriptional regulator [Clostridium sp.]MDU7337911.1 GntR family transcriptional regulator [Clostridium sp.]